MNAQRVILFAGILVSFMLLGCSKSDDQKEFEQQAYSTPENYTAMNANGLPAGSGQTDPDDWRISPMYQGMIKINTVAHPNPVVRNNSFEMDLDITGYESVPGIRIYVFKENSNDLYGTIGPYEDSPLPNGYFPIRINSSEFSGTGYTEGLFRLVIFDGRNNVITYGDVRVE